MYTSNIININQLNATKSNSVELKLISNNHPDNKIAIPLT
jgi:hypothetical protein